ncbi:alpha/beta hydrolase [Kitasatospora kifunensis]|uniref:Enterochelin esterase-like enzyme n=1 Tax=Kitasatospora kifunensis TaxID=58351 RepID=A0A7W7R3N1_KITKI|nr:alpha/beta hydrolase-fold protein [Kitasatospora kifunensis]MBB4924756.1 enterochelin esterase-like enzyme [Kitasatospora kifunensis]
MTWPDESHIPTDEPGLRHALTQGAADLVVSPAPYTAIVRDGRGLRRRRTAVRTALAVTMVVVPALTLALLPGRHPAPPPDPGPAASSAAPKDSKVVMPAGPAADLKKDRDTKAGPIMVTTLAGKKSGVSADVWVWLPPQYNDPKYAKFGFPVLTLYAGGQSNGYNTWTDNQLPIQEIDAQLAQQQQAHPFIMIMPVQNLTGDEHQSLDCSDIPGQPKMGTWMSQDVPDFVRANFRTLKGRDSWGLMGAASGADCSAKLAMQRPDIFKAAVAIDGDFLADSPLWKGHQAEHDANSPDKLISTSKADVKMLATAGGGEAYEVGVVKKWVANAAAPTTVEYYEQPGGKHLTADFAKLIPMTLDWLTKNLTGPESDS